MTTSPFLPLPEHWSMTSATLVEGTLYVQVAVRSPQVECPDCATPSQRVHGHYTRTLNDLPTSGQHVVLQVTVRKFFCGNPHCGRKLFTEQCPVFTLPYARRTNRLIHALQAIGLLLGGRPGARLARCLGMPSSAATILADVMHLPIPPSPPVRILGIDEWAWKKGWRYGTMLVDLERHQVVDILPSDATDTVQQWLITHPGIEVVTRDRASAFADAARQGVPTACQIADRFHLLVNVRAAVQRLLERHRASLPTEAQIRPPDEQPSPLVDEAMTRAHLHHLAYAQAPAPPRHADVMHGRARRALRLERYEQVRVLHRQGMGIRAIARTLGMARQTVEKYAAATTFPERASSHVPMRGSILDPFVPYILRRWREGCYTGMQIYREILAQGYTGSVPLVGLLISDLRRVLPPALDLQRSDAAPVDPRARPLKGPHAIHHLPGHQRLSPREATWLFLTSPTNLTPRQQRQVQFVCNAHPEVQRAYDLARVFVQLVTQRRGDELGHWLAEASTSQVAELHGLARGIRRDEAAVQAALSSPWSTGQVEGQINRLKMLKRTMFGRAGYALLRQRLLVQL